MLGKRHRSASSPPQIRQEAIKKVKPGEPDMKMADDNKGDSDGNIRETLIQILNRVNKMDNDFNCRFDRLEQNFAERIAGMVQEEVAKVRDEIKNDMVNMKAEVEAVKKRIETRKIIESGTCNVVMFGVPEIEGENIVEKVNRVIKEGVKEDVKVEKAVRRKSKKEGKPGIVIATFTSMNEKEMVMKNKSKLSRSTNHKSVSIDHERSGEECCSGQT